MRIFCWLALAACLLIPASALHAELQTLAIRKREPFAGGKAFGDAGRYEKITGIARFAVDPKHPRNQAIVDLSLAPRNERGLVEFESDVVILAPKNPAQGNHALLYDVNNRGNKLALGMFNEASGGNNPTTEKDAGNGFLFRHGYTVVWCGWIGEMLPGEGRLLLKAPVATENGKPIRGVVRYEISTDKPAESLPLSRRENHGSYSPTARGEEAGVLTWRMRETDDRVAIPHAQWSLERKPLPSSQDGVAPALGQIRVRLAGGFRPGYLYELIAEAEGPVVQGLGFAAVRDLVSFLKNDASEGNPLRMADGKKPAIARAHAFGVSQSGRFLRNYLYLGFNADESERKVFDGLIPHVAGGGLGFFNHRFAQPTRFNGQHEDHLYPIDYFPFTYGDSTDPFMKRVDGILRHTEARFQPKVMHTQSAAEYWHRSGALVHTDPLGKEDVKIPDNVRIYAFGGTQHGPAADANKRGDAAENLVNPGNYKPFLRGLLEALDAWVRDGTEPPPSVYPRIADGTLVDFHQANTGFPAIPGIRYPEVIQRPAALDYGPEYQARGIISLEPPRILGHYNVLVAKCGADGNDLGSLLPPEVAMPLATYTGWNLRRREAGAEAMLAGLQGSYIPFAKTKAERMARGDPRPSIEERYQTREVYGNEHLKSCQDLIERRFLLKEDLQQFSAFLEKARDQFPGPAR